MHSRDILLKAKGDHLDLVHTDQKVLEMIRQGRPRVSKLTQEDCQARGHSEQMVLVIVRQ
jgi:hypothetical protein